VKQNKDIKILILGGGFGGIYTLLHLRKALKKQKNIYVTLVNRENFFLFTPFLHEVATGGIETRHIAYPIRQINNWQNFRFIHGEVTSIELEQRKVFLGEQSLDYDYLILALGNVSDILPKPPFDGNVFTLKTLSDGMFLRNHIIQMFETADAELDMERRNSLLSFVVVGGGSTGVQLVTEMRDFIHRFLLKSYPRVQRDRVHIRLIQDKNYILEGMDEQLGIYALECLHRKGIDVRLNTRVESLTSEGLQLGGQGEISSCTVIWATGGRVNPLIADLPVSKDKLNRIAVNEYLEVPGFNGVYALGDIIHFKDNRWEYGLPPRAHIAVRQARTVAANIVAGIFSKEKKPYRYIHMGETVSLGSHTAAINIFGVRIYGVIARFIWLNGYLSLLMGWFNRLRVLTDWFLALIFGRDITMLDIDNREKE